MGWDCWEGDPINVPVELQGKYQSADTVTFVIWDESGAKIRHTQNVAGPQVVCDWQPDMAGTDKPVVRRMFLYVECLGREITGSVPLDIWCHEVVVEGVRSDDGKPIKGARVLVEGGASYFTDDKGQAKIPITEFKEVQVTWGTPYELYDWQQGAWNAGRHRKARLDEVPLTAAILAPKTGRWYNDHESTHLGNSEGLTVPVVTSVGSEVEGVEVHIRVEFDAGNSKLNIPCPQLEYGGNLTERAAEEGGRIQTGKGKTTEAGTATFMVKVGAAGGDKVKIKVGTTSAVEDDAIELETWRRAFVRVAAADGLKLPNLDKVTSAWEPGFVEVQLDVADTPIPDDGTIPGWYTTIDGQRWMAGGSHNIEALARCDHFPPETRGPYARVAVVNSSVSYKDDNGRVLFKNWDRIKLPVKAVTTVQEKQGGFTVSLPCGRLFKERVDEPGDGVIASWASLAEPTRWHRIPVSDMQFTGCPTTGMATKVIIPFPREAIAAAEREDFIWWDVSAYWGELLQGIAQARLRMTLAVQNEDLASTMIHELGHAFGQVAKRQLLAGGKFLFGMERHPRQDQGCGHTGSHCATGLSGHDWMNYEKFLENYGGEPSFHGLTGSCVMFGEGGGGKSPTAFCADCVRWIKGTEIKT